MDSNMEVRFLAETGIFLIAPSPNAPHKHSHALRMLDALSPGIKRLKGGNVLFTILMVRLRMRRASQLPSKRGFNYTLLFAL
jgi:hypothetical protein